MAAPTHVQTKRIQLTGSTTPTCSYASATTSGNLLTLAARLGNGQSMSTPTGWTLLSDQYVVSPSGGNRLYIFYRKSNGLTDVSLTLSSGSGDQEVVMSEHSGLTNPEPYTVAQVHRDADPTPGYVICPSVSYPAAPAAVLMWGSFEGPESPSSVTASGTGAVLRTAITYSDAQKQLGLLDVLRDAGSGATALYPAAGGIRFLFTHNAYRMAVGVAFVDGAPSLDCDFAASVTSGVAPLEVDFTDLTVGTPDGWLWDFGDGDTSTSQNPTHTYLTSGVFTVTLTATRSGDDDECTKTVTALINVGPAGVYIDWDGDGFTTDDADNVSTNVMSWTIRRGASPEITGGSQPGSATLILKNPSDVYNPRNEAGALYELLRDGVPVWIGPNSDGVLTGDDPRGLFAGRITDITLLPEGGATVSPTVEIQCEDAIGWYRRIPVQLDYSEGRSHGALRAAALAAAGEPRVDLASEIMTMPLSRADGDLLSILDAINGANGTRHFAKPSDVLSDWYLYTTRNRQYKLAGVADEALSASSQHVTGTDGWRLSADTVTNRQKVSVIPITFTPSTFTVWEADQLPITVDEDHPYTRTVDFDDVVSGAVLDYASTGDTVISELTVFGGGATISLTVAAGDAASITALSIEGRLARRLPTESYVANDLTSQAPPRGIRDGSEISGEYVGVMAAAAGLAEHVVWRQGNPQLRPTLTVENWFPEMFELDLFDVISFTSTHLGMSGVLFEIVGVEHRGNVAAATVQHHVTTYVLQESRVQAPYGWFVLDTSELDSADHLGY